MSDVEYYLPEKDGENSKCGVLDLGKCVDSDENSAGESTFSKEANAELQKNLPARGESLEENKREANTTNIMGHTQESKGSDDQLLSFLSTQEDSPDVNPNREAQSEKDMNVCKSPENILKDLIDMNVGVSLSTESLQGNGVNPQEKNRTAIPKQTTDMSHSSSVENTHPHSTKIQDEVADNHANSKSLTEILDDFCNAPSEIMAPSEMSFSALVENDDTEKTSSPNSQLQNQDIEMTEIWSGENAEKVIENGTLRQSMKVEDLKDSNADALNEEVMETEEDAGNKINSSEDSHETEENVIDQLDNSEKSEESTKIPVEGKERTEKESDAIEAKVDDKDSEAEMETAENEDEDTKIKDEVISVDENEFVDSNAELEENAADVNKIGERDLGSSSKDAVERELEGTAMETDEEESIDEELKGKGVANQEKGNAGELISVDLEGNQRTKESDGDELSENTKKMDEVSEDTENDLADEEAKAQEKSENLIDKERNVSEDLKSNLVDDDRNSQEKSESLTDKERSLENKEEKIHDEPEDVVEEEKENSQKDIMKENSEENIEHQSSEPVNLKENEHENTKTINDKDSTDEAKAKSPEKLGDAGNSKNSDTKPKNQDEISEDKSVKIQVLSRNSEAIVENATKTNCDEKSAGKEATISETEKEIFEGSKPKSAKSVVEARPQLPPKSSEAVSSKGKSKVGDESPLAISSDRQSNTDDDSVNYDEESIENITKTIKSFTSESSSDKKQDKRIASSKKADSSETKQVIVVKTSSNVERVKRKLEEILEKSKGEEDAAIAELQRMKKEKTDILNAITTEMEKLKAILVKGKQG